MTCQRVLGLWLLALLLTNSAASGQGVQTSSITGVVTTADGLPLAGVIVEARSPALQGAREMPTDLNGVYYLRGLPSGRYELTFTLTDFQPSTRQDVLAELGGISRVDAVMAPATVVEMVTVTAEMPPSVSSAATAQSYSKREADALPVGRRPVDVAELAPGLTNNTFAAGQLSIGGAFGFDNVFMIDGADVGENIFGSSNDLFVEDAIQETTVHVHGISAAYGRFSGGVVNVVTRSGGDIFSGSFRQNVSNPVWVAETPRQRQNGISNPSRASHTYEGTFGGPIARNRLWFFGAARYEESATQNTFAQTSGTYTRTISNRRAELKLTATPVLNHSIQGTYINNFTEQANTSGLPLGILVDASTLYTRQLPNQLLAVNYRGAVSPRALASLQYSHKRDGRRNNGGSSRDITDSPFVTVGATRGVPPFLFFHAPYFDSTDPEDRNNRQVTGSLSYLLSTRRVGTHDLSGGVEHFTTTGIGGNSQSPTGYVFNTDYATEGGRPVLDAQGRPVPLFMPGVTSIWNILATRGARIDIKTTSIYLEDRWNVGRRLTLQLGVRAEAVQADATGDITTADTSTVVPRLAVGYNLAGDGRTSFHATYGHYAGKYNQAQFSANTSVGNPSEVDYVYEGPAGQGSDFAPGFDLANYREPIYANFPIANVRMADGLHSPLTREFTAAIARQWSPVGHSKATYVWRTMSGFIDDVIDLSTGVTTIPLIGTVANRVYSNTDQPVRDYQALILQSTYRPLAATTVGGHYTLQLRNHGNFAGESAARPIPDSVFGNYPEIFASALDRLAPEGRLDGYQRHKLRIYTIHSQSLGRFGSVDVAPMWRVNSGTAYSHTAMLALTAAQLARNPGYPPININPAVRQMVFFGDRGEHDFSGYGLVDLAATYSLRVWRTAAPWVKVELYNVLNNQKQIGWDRTVSADPTSARDDNGLPTAYVQGPRYGTATSDAHYPQPYSGQIGGRAFRMAFGVRF